MFVDGAFWHGHPDYYRGQSGKFWDEKIAANRRRDRAVDAELRSSGWLVLRFWDFEIESDAESSARRVAAALARRDLDVIDSARRRARQQRSDVAGDPP